MGITEVSASLYIVAVRKRSMAVTAPVDGPQGSIPRTSGLSQWPQALDSHATQNPQGGGGRSATQSRHSYASEARTQSESERAFEEFRSVGDRLRALNEEIHRETIYGGPVTGSVTEEDTRMLSAPPKLPRHTQCHRQSSALYGGQNLGSDSCPTRFGDVLDANARATGRREAQHKSRATPIMRCSRT